MKLLILLFIGIQSYSYAQTKYQDMKTTSTDEAAIRALHERFAKALGKGDVNEMMKVYMPGKNFVIFDVVPRNKYYGSETYREDWVDFFSHYKGTPTIEVSHLVITVDGNVGFSHSFQRVKGTSKEGQPIDMTVLVTDGYRKIDGKWLIAQEHVSLPVDLMTGKAVPVTQ